MLIRVLHDQTQAERCRDTHRLGQSRGRLATLQLADKSRADAGAERDILQTESSRASRITESRSKLCRSCYMYDSSHYPDRE
jgi:hypothetical protein